LHNAPAIALTSPVSGASYIAPATVAMVPSVTPNGHTISQVQSYNGTTLLGTDTSAPYTFSWNNVSVGSYSLSAKLVYDSASVLGSVVTNVTVGAARPPSGLTFAADSGAFSAPFADNNGTLSQSVTTGVANGGQAAYAFNIPTSGN
jgi:hypothetical protein